MLHGERGRMEHNALWHGSGAGPLGLLRIAHRAARFNGCHDFGGRKPGALRPRTVDAVKIPIAAPPLSAGMSGIPVSAASRSLTQNDEPTRALLADISVQGSSGVSRSTHIADMPLTPPALWWGSTCSIISQSNAFRQI